MRVAVKIAYNGNKFHGFARQPDLLTVEGELIKALVKHGVIEDTQESRFRYASRTDKGVSALCNVIAFNSDFNGKDVVHIISDENPDILAYAFKEFDNDFNPRYARIRQYRYYLSIGNLDTEKMLSTAAVFIGKNNYSNFSRLESFKDPVRRIENIVFNMGKKFVLIDFYGHTFLWNQIRRIISALIKIGQNEIEKQDIVEALSNPDKNVDYGVAPAEYLLLKDIIYDFNFKNIRNMLSQIKNFEKSFEKTLDISSFKY